MDSPQAAGLQACTLLFVAVVAIMVAARLDGSALAAASLAVCLVPLWLVASCGFCIFSCTVPPAPWGPRPRPHGT